MKTKNRTEGQARRGGFRARAVRAEAGRGGFQGLAPLLASRDANGTLTRQDREGGNVTVARGAQLPSSGLAEGNTESRAKNN